MFDAQFRLQLVNVTNNSGLPIEDAVCSGFGYEILSLTSSSETVVSIKVDCTVSKHQRM